MCMLLRIAGADFAVGLMQLCNLFFMIRHESHNRGTNCLRRFSVQANLKKKVQVGKDQETKVGKNQTNNQVLIP